MMDQVIVGLYLLVTLTIGLLVGRNTKTIREFSVGKRNFSSVILLSTIFASVVDGNGTLGLAEAVFSQGPMYCLAFLGIVLSYFTLAFFIAPRFNRFLGLFSSGDILGKLYGPYAKIFMGFATVFESTMLTGIQILAMIHITQHFFHLTSETAAFGTTLIILFYSLRGGIRAVTATDVFQFGVLIIAVPAICGIALTKIGGIDGLNGLIQTVHQKSSTNSDPLKQIAIFFSFSLPALFPLTLQRMLMAKNTKQIKTTFFATGLLSLPFYLMVACISLSAHALIPDIPANFVFPGLIDHVLPIGLKGFVIAGLLAVFMSSIDSSLNVAAVAITHDIFTPLSRRELKEKPKLKIARISSVLISMIAVSMALYFNNIIDMMFLLLCISNSAFFPGYLIGLLGLKPSRKGFWIGLITACISVLVLTFVIGLFELYTGLISIFINVAILLISHVTSNDKAKERLLEEYPKVPFRMSLNVPALHTMFAIFTIITSLGIFFVQAAHGDIKQSPFLLIHMFVATTSFLLLFRELWWSWTISFFIPLLHLIITLSLPTITVLMLLCSGFNTIWIVDAIVCFAILTILTNTKTLLTMVSIGSLGSIFIFLWADFPSVQNLSELGSWSLTLHVLTLTFAFFILRKQETERYHFLSGKLAHETSRSMSSLMLSAEFLSSNLPSLVASYRWASTHGFSDAKINDEILTEIKEFPIRLYEMGNRTADTVNILLKKLYSIDKPESNRKSINLIACAQCVALDPSITTEQRKKLIINHNHSFSILGDYSQISQMILNIIENAVHAISKKEDGFIEIWAKENTLLIQDNGIGISERDLPNIFDEFFSTKKTMGQGLSFCKQVMNDHNGTILCESKENLFTRFELIFPKWS